jgi:hypothetical protein
LVYTRGLDVGFYVSAKIRRHGVALDKQRYKEQWREELKAEYNYTVIA